MLWIQAKWEKNAILKFYKAGAPLEMISNATGMNIQEAMIILKKAWLLEKD